MWRGWELFSGEKPLGQVRGEFELPYYDPSQPSKLLSYVSGMGLQLTPEGELKIFNIKIIAFEPGGNTNFIAMATNCLYNPEFRKLYSPAEIFLYSVDHKSSLSGRGFSFFQEKSLLVISNDVVTKLSGGNNDELFLTSKSANIDLNIKKLNFLGPIYSEKGPLRLEAKELEIKLSQISSNELEYVKALGNVHFQDTQNAICVLADSLEFFNKDNSQEFYFKDNVRWSLGQHYGSAGMIKFSLNTKKIEMTQTPKATLILNSPTNNFYTNKTVEVEAMQIIIEQLTEPIDFANLRIYTEGLTIMNIKGFPYEITASSNGLERREDGQLILKGPVEWEAKDWRGRGTEFVYDEKSGDFEIKGPVSLVVSQALLWPVSKETEEGSVPEKNIVINASQVYSSGKVVTLNGPVKAHWLSENGWNTSLAADMASAFVANYLQEVDLSRNIKMYATKNETQANLFTQTAKIRFNNLGQIIRLEAEPFDGEIIIDKNQMERYFVQGGRMQVEFTSQADPIDRLILEKHATIYGLDLMVRAEYMVYEAHLDKWRLEGSPWIWYKGIRVYGAEPIEWVPKTDQIYGKGAYRIIWIGNRESINQATSRLKSYLK